MSLKKSVVLLLLWMGILSGCQAALEDRSAPGPREGARPSETAQARAGDDTIRSPTGLYLARGGEAQPEAAISDAGLAASDVPALSATARPSATLRPTHTRTPTSSPPPYETHYVTAGRAVVPILMYHHISDNSSTRYTVTVRTFRAQMQALKARGYETITIAELAQVVRYGGRLPLKPVVLTFDDGYLDTYQNAFPVLEELGYRGVAYVITGTLGTELSYGYMQEKELKELAAAGWEIGSHSITHTDLRNPQAGLSQGVGNEIKKSQQALEKMLGVPVVSFSYPFGSANASIKELVESLGYEAAVGLDIANTHTRSQLYYLSRREVYRELTLEAFLALLEPGEVDQYIDLRLTGTPGPTATPDDR